MDNWKETWDWAKGVWGEDTDYGFNRFFGRVASEIARNEGWDELGSSDVWHCSFWCVEQARKAGTVDSREALKKYVCDHMGVYFF